jgi:uncharacterized protein YuzE
VVFFLRYSEFRKLVSRDRPRYHLGIQGAGDRASTVTIHNVFLDRIPRMKLAYYSATDSLYIGLAEQPSVESQEVSEGIVLDYGADGRLVGIDIDNASHKVQLKPLVLTGMDGEVEKRAS